MISRRKRQLSHKWATLQETADNFCTSTTSIRLGRGPYARLKRASVGGRILILRSSVDKLDRELERSAVDLTGNVTDIEEGRQRSIA